MTDKTDTAVYTGVILGFAIIAFVISLYNSTKGGKDKIDKDKVGQAAIVAVYAAIVGLVVSGLLDLYDAFEEGYEEAYEEKEEEVIY